MGQIRDDFGRVSIEARSESFIIHTDYGYAPQACELRALKVGQWFFHRSDVGEPVGRQWQVVREELHPDKTRSWEVRHVEADEANGLADIGAVEETITNGNLLVLWGYPESFSVNLERAAEGSFAERWRGSHPEFMLKDLNDLITALEDLRASL